jgi:hypothetical protein
VNELVMILGEAEWPFFIPNLVNSKLHFTHMLQRSSQPKNSITHENKHQLYDFRVYAPHHEVKAD